MRCPVVFWSLWLLDVVVGVVVGVDCDVIGVVAGVVCDAVCVVVSEGVVVVVFGVVTTFIVVFVLVVGDIGFTGVRVHVLF